MVKKNSGSSTYKIVGETGSVLVQPQTENLKMVPGDYDVVVVQNLGFKSRAVLCQCDDSTYSGDYELRRCSLDQLVDCVDVVNNSDVPGLLSRKSKTLENNKRWTSRRNLIGLEIKLT